MTTRYSAQAALQTCSEHPDENLDTYCTTCNKRVCEACRNEHKDHKWIRGNRLSRMVRQNAEARCQDIIDMLIKMKEAKTALLGHKQIDDIRSMQSKLVAMVSEYTETMVLMIQSGADDTSISEEIQDLERLLDFFQNQLDTADENVMMEVEEKFHMKREKFSYIQNSNQGMTFVEGTLSSDVLHHMFGKVMRKDSSGQGDRSEVEVTEISQFTHVDDSTSINDICLVSYDVAWIKRRQTKQIDKVDNTGQVINERKVPNAVDFFTVLDNDDIFCTISRLNLIRIVTSSGTVRDVCFTAPLRPKGICRSRDGGVIVCLDDCTTADITADSRGEVYLMDKSGKILEKYSRTGDKKDQLFIHPNKISQNINLDLCVVDTIDEEYRSRLVVVSISSMIRFTYSGQPALTKKFSSADVACDDRGRILLTDLYNHAVHLLSEDGHFLQFILTKQSHLRWPHSLALHHDTLWVTCDKGVVRVYKYDKQVINCATNSPTHRAAVGSTCQLL